MTRAMGGVSLACTAIVATGLMFAADQSSPARPKKNTAHKAASTSKPDNWIKMKECAVQAEKVLAESNVRNIKFGGNSADEWSNHYSPKYNRCFVSMFYLRDTKATVRGGPMSSTVLTDAFERAILATSAAGPSAQLMCRNEENTQDCERGAEIVWKAACAVNGIETACAKAKEFIDEHMKN
jgi:hypothetical protein